MLSLESFPKEVTGPKSIAAIVLLTNKKYSDDFTYSKIDQLLKNV